MTIIIKNYAVFAIVKGFELANLRVIPLVMEKGKFPKKMWKLPGGRPQEGEYPEITLLRELDDEIGVVVEYPEKEIFKKEKINKEKVRYDFIVFEAKYHKGILGPNKEIEQVKLFNFTQIKQMIIESKEILPDHAEVLSKYIDEEAFDADYYDLDIP